MNYENLGWTMYVQYKRNSYGKPICEAHWLSHQLCPLDDEYEADCYWMVPGTYGED
jgi:hypothetical protein